MPQEETPSSSSLKSRQPLQLQQQQQQQQQPTTTLLAAVSAVNIVTAPPSSSGSRRSSTVVHSRSPRRPNTSSSSSSSATNGGGTTSSLSSDHHHHKEPGSVLWTLLLVGLFFCLIDISYMVVYLERRHQTIVTVTSSSISSGSIIATGGISGTIMHRQRHQQRRVVQQSPPIVTSSSSASDEENDNNTDAEAAEAEEQQQQQQNAGPPKTRTELEAERLPILDVLRASGIGDLDDETLRLLPTWAEFTSLYGATPKIYGLHTCEAFQNRSDPADHFVSTAGNFNTGTNLMAELLISNCHMQKRMDKYGEENRGIRWQVPWGKHTPPGDEAYRQSHKTRNDVDVDPNNIMPAVTIRDPYVWLKSMCRHPYGLEWPTTEEHCPNLVPNQYDLELYPFLRTMKSIPVFARYLDFDRNHDSLVHNWNDWYNEYMNVQFPFVMVRYEDLLFRPKEMTELVCRCAGGELNPGHFEYIVHSAKRGPGAHGNVRTSYVDALIQYGSPKHRLKGLGKDDIEFAHQHLDRRLMHMFGYPDPPQFAAANDHHHYDNNHNNEQQQEQ